MTAQDIVYMFEKTGVPFNQLAVKAFVIMPDDQKLIIEMEFVRALDGMDKSIIFQLESKGDLVPNVHPGT